MTEICTDFIAAGLEAENAEEVIRTLADLLYRKGAVSADYAQAAIQREARHPTGLPSSPFYIAFPHADADGVNRSALAVASLKKPVIFLNMADPDEMLPVELVFMLANNSPEDQILTLRNLASLFSQPEKLVELRALSSPESIAAWLQREINQIGGET